VKRREFTFFDCVALKIDPENIGMIRVIMLHPDGGQTYGVYWPDGGESFHYSQELNAADPILNRMGIQQN
jgi:hypothetical protein